MMKVDRVFRTIDRKGRKVLFGRLENGSVGAIRYSKNNIRHVAGYNVSDADILEAYDKYEAGKNS